MAQLVLPVREDRLDHKDHQVGLADLRAQLDLAGHKELLAQYLGHRVLVEIQVIRAQVVQQDQVEHKVMPDHRDRLDHRADKVFKVIKEIQVLQVLKDQLAHRDRKV